MSGPGREGGEAGRGALGPGSRGAAPAVRRWHSDARSWKGQVGVTSPSCVLVEAPSPVHFSLGDDSAQGISRSELSSPMKRGVGPPGWPALWT